VAAPIVQLKNICDEVGIRLIEDNAHGLDATYRGKSLGSFGALATQSFHETKNLHCGEGGALVVNDPTLVEPAEVFREKGTNRSKFFRGHVDKYSWIGAGSSMLLGEPLAAMLEGQLEDFRETQARRLTIWNDYDEELRDVCSDRNWKQPTIPDDCEHPAHLYYLIVNNLEERQELLTHMRNDQIQATFHYQPLHSSSAGRKFGKTVGELRNTDIVADRLIRLPLWPDMTDDHVRHIVKSIKRFVI
jgi:dTDP-4-amino-4,6-dideoxygalactose transaminase